jgi:hypothetical protein
LMKPTIFFAMTGSSSSNDRRSGLLVYRPVAMSARRGRGGAPICHTLPAALAGLGEV